MNIILLNIFKTLYIFLAFIVGMKINSKIEKVFKKWVNGEAYPYITRAELSIEKSFIQYLFKQKRTSNEAVVNTLVFLQILLLVIAVLMIPYAGTVLINGKILSLDLVTTSGNGLYLLLIITMFSFIDVSLLLTTKSDGKSMLAIIVSPLIINLCLLAMLYEYGTFSLHEIVQFQNTKNSLGLSRIGVLINPAVAVLYFASLCYWIKSSVTLNSKQNHYSRILHSLFHMKKFLLIMSGVYFLLGGYGPIYSLNIFSRDYILLNIVLDSLNVLFKYVFLNCCLGVVLSGLARRSERTYSKELRMIILPTAFIMMSSIIILKFIRS